MLFFASQALAADVGLRVEQPDLPPYQAVLCGVSEDGTSSPRLQVPAPGLLAWQFHVQASPGDREGDLLLSVPFAVVDLRARAPGDSESEWHTITPVTVPAFQLPPGGSTGQAYPVQADGALHPQVLIPGQTEPIVPRLSLTVTLLVAGSEGCSR
jgi:hypothetical protein